MHKIKNQAVLVFQQYKQYFAYVKNNKHFMKTTLRFLLACSMFSHSAHAQSGTVDKNKVMDFFQNQQFDEALSYLLPAVLTDTQNIQLLGYLGYANYMSDNTKAAEKYYQDIFNIDSANISAIQYLAIINKNESPDRALQFTRRLIYLQPGKAAHYRSMAEIFRRREKKDSAFLYYSKAYELAPKDYKTV